MRTVVIVGGGFCGVVLATMLRRCGEHRAARPGAQPESMRVGHGEPHYLGPMLHAEHWEATAAAELAVHAERLAAHLCQHELARTSTTGRDPPAAARSR
jgi:hypothetical protein